MPFLDPSIVPVEVLILYSRTVRVGDLDAYAKTLVGCGKRTRNKFHGMRTRMLPGDEFWEFDYREEAKVRPRHFNGWALLRDGRVVEYSADE